MKKIVKEIMREFDTNCLTIECCDYAVRGVLLTHCYYVNGEFIFTSGDMENDKYAEEIILNDNEINEVLEAIIECYN